MNALDRKLLRDLARLWPQALAIALVMAAGVATLVLGIGAHASLDQTRQAYYDRYLFAHVFADVTRAPKSLGVSIADGEGIAAAETRIVKIALLHVPGMIEPASAMFVSLPDLGEPSANRILLRRGRLPEPETDDETVVSHAFAEEHALDVGDTLKALLNGRKRDLEIVGVAMSPEFIYAMGPGEAMPDARRFGIAWMSETALAAAYDLDGAFSNVVVRMSEGASEAAVIDHVDRLLKPYGGTGAYGRKDQQSHAFLDAELDQLRVLSRFLPPIFLLVAAFLVNMTMARLVALEREQIGLLKALGYGSVAIIAHYLKFVAAIALIGVAIGSIAGTWLGVGLTQLFGKFYKFPFLIFQMAPDVYAIAAGVTLGAAILGAVQAVSRVAGLTPAVAMSPPAPPRYRRFFSERLMAVLSPPQTVTMATRHLIRFPVRTLTSIAGVALAVSVLVGSLWSHGSVALMIDVMFFQAERQHASINFTEKLNARAAFEAAGLPGVLAVEPYRSVSARVRFGPAERRVGIIGKPPGTDLSRILDLDLNTIRLPETGLAMSSALANILEARIGDVLEVDLLAYGGRTVEVPVTAIVEGYFGLALYMDMDTLNRLTRDGAVVSGVHLLIDAAETDRLYTELKESPVANFIALQRVSLQKFRETIEMNINTSTAVYVGLAVIIAFGVVYNFARISLSERGRELASLRVLGFTRGEVASILFIELAVVTLLAQPIGWLIGYGIAVGLIQGFDSELYRIPLVIEPNVYAFASVVTITAALVSAFVIRRRIAGLDLIAVLKTRE
ncbi:MAG: ABC transporter permease [Pseudomonadota bacterium]